MSSGGKVRTASTYLQCPECDTIQTIYRKRNRMKEKYHIKHLWCWKCKEVTGHIEVKEEAFYPDWLKEEDA